MFTLEMTKSLATIENNDKGITMNNNWKSNRSNN